MLPFHLEPNPPQEIEKGKTECDENAKGIESDDDGEENDEGGDKDDAGRALGAGATDGNGCDKHGYSDEEDDDGERDGLAVDEHGRPGRNTLSARGRARRSRAGCTSCWSQWRWRVPCLQHPGAHTRCCQTASAVM